MRCEAAVVLGAGALAQSCLEALLAAGLPPRQLAFYETGAPALSLGGPARFAQKQGIAAHKPGTADTARALLAITRPTLVVSAGNGWIIPAEVCRQPQLRLVNNHSALLPRHPGSNAPTWAIFHGDALGGITWHQLDAGIDTGGILAQASIPLPEDITALALARRYAALSAGLFGHIAASLLQGGIRAEAQPSSANRRVYKRSDVPCGGRLPLHDAPLAWRMLRSMDYGAAARFAPPTAATPGGPRAVTAYRRLAPGEAPQAPEHLLEGEGLRLALQYEEVKG